MLLSSFGIYLETNGSIDAFVSYLDRSATSTTPVGKTSTGGSRVLIAAPSSGHSLSVDTIQLSNNSSAVVTLSVYYGDSSNGSLNFTVAVAQTAVVQFDGTKWIFPTVDTSSSSGANTAGSIALATGNILVGNSEGIASAVLPTGDLRMSVSGKFVLTNSGISPGWYYRVRVDNAGRVLEGSSPTTLAGYGILDAAKSGVNSDIVALQGLSTPLSVAQGGTGSTNASGAREAIACASRGSNSDITALSGLQVPLSVSQGGTGAATVASARTSLGLTPGVDVQAFSADLKAIASLPNSAGFLYRNSDLTWRLDTTRYLSAALASGRLYAGDADGNAIAVVPSGDITMSATGVFDVKSLARKSFGPFATGTDASNLTGYVPSDCIIGECPNISAVGALHGGTWNADIVQLPYGGTSSDLSTTGPGLVTQQSVGAPLTVLSASNGTILTVIEGVPTFVPVSGDVTFNNEGESVLVEITTAGTFTQVTIDAKGRVVSATSPTTLSGYGITDAVSSSAIDTDTMLAADSDSKIPSQKAVKYYIDNHAVGCGNVVGPSSSTDGQFALFADTSGKLLKAATLSGDASVSSTGVASVTSLRGGAVSIPASGVLASRSAAQTWGGQQTFAVADQDTADIVLSPSKFNTHGGEPNKIISYNHAGEACYGFGISSATGYDLISGDNGFGFYTGATAPNGVTNAALRWRILVGGALVPGAANTAYIGSAALPLAGGYTQTTFTVTSGKEFKENIRDFTAAEIAVAKSIAKTCPRAYQLVTSVAEKGTDKARFHYGAVYEDVYQTFVDAGWTTADIERCALFVAASAKKTVTTTRTVSRQKTEAKTRTIERLSVTNDVAVLTTTTETYEAPAYKTLPVKDVSGNVVYEDDGKTARTYQNPVMEDVIETYTEEVDDTDATPIRGLRYTELMMWLFVGLAELRKDDLAAIAALTARVAALEAK